MQMMATAGQAFRCLGCDVAGIEAIAGAGFGFELRPKLADLEPFGYSAPEIPEVDTKRDRPRSRLSGRWGGGCHRVSGNYRSFLTDEWDPNPPTSQPTH